MHLQEPIEITAIPQALGVSEDCLNFSFEQVRGMTPAQTKVLNKLDRYALLVIDDIGYVRNTRYQAIALPAGWSAPWCRSPGGGGLDRL